MDHGEGAVGILDPEDVDSGRSAADPTDAGSGATETVFTRQVRYITAICSLGAGLLHVLAMIDHRDSPTLARGFLAIAAVQVVWGVLLIVDPRKIFVLIGGLATAGAIGVWVFSRTKGISWFPGLDHVEPLGWRDVVTQFYELLAVAGAAILLLPASAFKPAGKRVEVLPIAVFAVFAMAVMAVLYAATHSGGHAH
jgi:hypothetical protein